MDHSAHHTGTVHGHTAPAGGHGHAEHGGRNGAPWSTAVKATLHCLTGCAIGEILGMVIGTALLWGNVPTMILTISLAFVFGYSFTLFAVVRAGLSLKAAIGAEAGGWRGLVPGAGAVATARAATAARR